MKRIPKFVLSKVSANGLFMLTTGAVVLALSAAAAHAQGIAVSAAYGMPFYGGGGHASTAAEGYANGMAAMVQSAGSYNLNTSQAAINLETARSQNLDNNLKGTQTYFEMRNINTAQRKSEDGRTMSSEEAWRYASMAVPKRLTAAQLDPVTGRIYWPLLLQDPRYETFRKDLEKLFVLRETSHGGIGYDTYMQIQQTIDGFLAALQKNIGEYPSGDYIRAKNFIDSLGYEAKLPAV
jgi:hypothetical protein